MRHFETYLNFSKPTLPRDTLYLISPYDEATLQYYYGTEFFFVQMPQSVTFSVQVQHQSLSKVAHWYSREHKSRVKKFPPGLPQFSQSKNQEKLIFWLIQDNIRKKHVFNPRGLIFLVQYWSQINTRVLFYNQTFKKRTI